MQGLKRKIYLYKDGEIVDVAESENDMAKKLNLSRSAVRYRIVNGLTIKGYTIKVEESETDVVLDRDKYIIIPYKTINHVCVTPCPFHYAPKPMVGSGKCIKCGSFKGRSRSTNEVACSFTKKV